MSNFMVYRRALYGFAFGASMFAATVTHAATLDVMAIGNSITWGYDGSSISNNTSTPPQTNGIDTNPPTTGGWRIGLQTNLNNLHAPNSFNFIGLKGDGVIDSYTSGELSGDSQTDDSVGPNHEGYSGWVIDALGGSGNVIYSDVDIDTTSNGVFYGNDSFPSDGTADRSGIANHLRTSSNTAGTIDPGNLNGNFSGPADVVMLSIGINDVIAFTGTDPAFQVSPYSSIADMVPFLGGLIDDIANVVPSSTKVLVSNLTPLGGDLFHISGSGTNANSNINTFNAKLLSDYFAGTFDLDGIAEHISLSNVFLLDANSALDDLTNDLLSDNVHPTAQGYGKLADFYADSFVALGLTIPEPVTASLVLLGGGLVLMRRSRHAA